MARSSVEKGQYIKLKTRDYFVACGYEVVLIEQYRTIRRKGYGKPIFQKKDTLGADMICVNDKECVLVNAVLGLSNVSKHKAEFLKHKRGNVKRLIIAWQPYERTPKIYNVDESEV